ncbi:NAD(P)-dependent oxidoreductase [Mycolicibacterium moriokaense]|uniref:3-hydroxyisobutyrate dehydrogenase n=1 Tax=Mycolicibacterium moriokaense TaxID=39691 RepID=A0A318H7F9_9MYCO|nr:NAD(P)-dependent oxidoreductase [Mycolicibacterium moriokaense]PXX00760.1 3-hydroxyisobutyrate dehydrogenase [Mycolicibacterium moriokaense]
MTTPPSTIAMLGTGTMGAPMARNLARAGFDLRVWNRTLAKAAVLTADGAQRACTPAEAAAGADVLITMLSDGAAVEQVTAGPTGALSALSLNAVWIQMSTVGVQWSDRFAELSAQHGVAFVDAPVSGSAEPAARGELEILASGADMLRPIVEPIFDVLGNRTVWLPRLGDGSRLKLALNNWLAVLVEGMAETLTLANALGVDAHVLLTSLAGRPLASQYALAKGAAMLGGDLAPGFPLRHATKDAELAVHAAHQHGVTLPLTDALLPRWHDAITHNHGGDDVASAVTVALATIGMR